MEVGRIPIPGTFVLVARMEILARWLERTSVGRRVLQSIGRMINAAWCGHCVSKTTGKAGMWMSDVIFMFVIGLIVSGNINLGVIDISEYWRNG